NEQYGENACDNILKSVYCGVNEDLTEKECMGRLVADNFCVLICDSDKDAMLSRFEGWYHNFERIVEKSAFEMLPIIWKLGVYSVIEKDKPLTHMIDRAKLALTKSAHERRGRLHFSFYDEKVRKILFKEKNLEDIMESALSNNEFQVYLQPKYLSESEKIGGAEALVRWQRPTGLIFPDEFIPLFEQNGFIIQIDLFVFREVCKLLRSWIDNKYEPIKISVNCSRVHLINSNFFDEYKAIAQEYNIPPKYLEIEFTENILFDNVELLIQTINEIHSAGFGCSMDDFGSGYSSLNLIQQIPVDTIKLDKIFFCNVSDFKRTEAIVSSVISMAKALGMGTVAEGVEIREQVDMLKELKCDLIQGYFFSKPLPISCFEELAFAKVS
ncbi:MAG: EAL domain-containing protein, partial [Clostridia bacterium]